MAGRWEHFEHAADAGVRGVGDTREEAFAQAALAVTALVADPARVEPRERVEIEVEARDPELLLAAFLNRVIWTMATRRMLFSRFDVALDVGRVRAAAWGEPVDLARHEPAVEPKGATLTSLAVARDEDGRWRAQCVVDV